MDESQLLWSPTRITLLLRINKSEIAPKISAYATDHGYAIKPEFHASIIGLQSGKKIIQTHGDNLEILQKVKSLADSFSWDVIYSQEYFVIEKYYNEEELEKSGYKNIPPHLRKTIIQKITIPCLGDFYQNLSQITGLEFEIPFPHITLFAWSDYSPMMTQGIGLYSENDFEKYCKEKI